LSDEAERPELEAVRRLLAEARHDQPMPDDVSGRMDRVMAGLSGDRDRRDARENAPVIPLAAHRRRRAAGLLVAAAAIVVGGFTAAQQLSGDSGGHTTAGGSVAEDQNAGANGQSSMSEPSGASPLVSPGTRFHAKLPQLKTLAGRVLVRPGHFAADVLSGRQATGPTPSAAIREVKLRRVPAGCVPALGSVEVVPATYEKAPSALVYHAPAGTTQVVDLYVCGTSRPVRSVTLPMP
jgi:hypothetical protein